MHLFTDFVDPGNPDDLAPHPEYLEVFFPLQATEPMWACAYVFLLSSSDGVNDIVAVTNWGEDQLGIAWNMFSPPRTEVVAEAYGTIWPTLLKVVANTKAGKYKKGALAKVVDPDDGVAKWVVAVARHDVPDAVLEAKGTTIAAQVASLSVAIAMELTTDLTKMQKARMIARGGADGYRRTKEAISPVEDALGWLRIVVGG